MDFAGLLSTEHINPFVVLTMGTALACVGMWARYKNSSLTERIASHVGVIGLLGVERDAWKARCERDEVERKEVDLRHELVLKEKRELVQKLQDALHECTVNSGVQLAKIADLVARTDFKPVYEFQQNWYKESTAQQKKLMEIFGVLTPVLDRAVMLLEKFRPDGTLSVEVVQKPGDAVNVKEVNGGEHPKVSN